MFPDEDDPINDAESQVDALASGLETFATSEYDYAKYLREIVLEPVAAAEKGEIAYRPYSYELSCGKFMNTLFLLVLRRACSLETFRWVAEYEGVTNC